MTKETIKKLPQNISLCMNVPSNVFAVY